METRSTRTDTKFFEGIRKGSLLGAYFLHGAEEFTKERAIRLLRATLAPAVAQMNEQQLTNPSAADVRNACETLPFFDERRIVTVRELTGEEGSALCDYVERVPESTLLLFYYRGEARKDGTLYKKLNKLGRVVDFAAYDEDMAAAFLEKRAATNGFSLEKSAARRLVRLIGTDLSGLENGLLKAGAYAGPDKPVTTSIVERCITPNVEYKVFSMLDLFVAGNRKDGLSMLSAMTKGGESAMGIAAFLEGRVKLMLTAKALILSGLSDADAASKLGGSPYAAKMTVKNARRCTREQLEKAVVAFGQVDLLQKQGRMKDADALLLAVMNVF